MKREPMIPVTAAKPCPVCDKPDWCLRAPDGSAAICQRVESANRAGDAGWLHKLSGADAKRSDSRKGKAGKDWTRLAVEFAVNLPRPITTLKLGLPDGSFDAIPLIGWNPAATCYTFPEMDAGGTVIGIVCRSADGTKKAMVLSKRGLTLPTGWRNAPGPCFVVEGPTDAAAMTATGLCAVGRPSNSGGVKLLAELFADWPVDRAIVIVGENDKKPNGEWPGRDGADAVAKKLSGLLRRPILRTLPPPDAKDVRNWLTFESHDNRPWGDRGESLAKSLNESAVRFDPPQEPLPTSTTGLDTEGRQWPAPLDPEAFIGPIGDYVLAVEPATEADLVAMLLQSLILFGNAIGRSAFLSVGADKHYTNEFAVIVGETAGGRKGTSFSMARALFLDSDSNWLDYRLASGMSSGEGLIHFVRDPVEQRQPIKEKGRTVDYETVIVDEGVTDKRGMITESEFVGALKQAERQGNTLSTIVRQAWETGTLRTLTKNSPTKATNAHISILGHITEAELKKYLSEVETANGFANRFLWIVSRRTKFLPEEPLIPSAPIHAARKAVAIAIADGKLIGAMTRSADAQAIWRKVYEPLETGCGGLAGSMLARAAAHVNRLSIIYALTERSPIIEARHLTAGLAVWEYVVASVKYLFGDSTGDSVADETLALIRNCAGGISRTEISNFFQRNVSSGRLGRALALLLKLGKVRREEVPTDGRPAERWHAVRGNP